jgi:hypothetical protein
MTDWTTSKRTMKDVSHTPPTGESVTNVWQRGRTTEETPDPTEATRDYPNAASD